MGRRMWIVPGTGIKDCVGNVLSTVSGTKHMHFYITCTSASMTTLSLMFLIFPSCWRSTASLPHWDRSEETLHVNIPALP